MLNPNAEKQYAVRDLVRDYNTGRMNVVFKDANTGQVIDDPSGYEIIESGGFMDLADLGIDPVQTPTSGTPTQRTVSQEVVDNAVYKNSDESSGSSGSRGGFSRDPSNNFGYVAQPGLLTAASFVPGPIGTVAKAGRIGLSMNEAAAANAARQTIGMEDTRSFMGKAKDAFTGRQGYIGDISYSDGQGRSRSTPVSFEAEDPVGRTTLTPQEARSRSLTSNVTTTSQPDTKAAMRSFQTSDLGKSQNKGLLSETFGSLRSATGSIMSSILGREATPSTVAQAAASKAAANPVDTSGWSEDTGTASTSQFGAPTNENMSVESQYGSYGAGKSGNSFGGSAQADAAAADPDGGLY